MGNLDGRGRGEGRKPPSVHLPVGQVWDEDVPLVVVRPL